MTSKNVYQRINAVMMKVKSINKGALVKMSYNSSYSAVSHDDVAALLHVPCTEEGLVIIPDQGKVEVLEFFVKDKDGYEKRMYRVDINLIITVQNIDDKQDHISFNSFAFAFDTSDKAVGKAYSYAFKYALLKLFMLESKDEEEERIVEKYEARPQLTIPKKEISEKEKLITNLRNLVVERTKGKSKDEAALFCKSVYGLDFAAIPNMNEDQLRSFIENINKLEWSK